ncbi:M20/M25/M40 family metallo-hydrolase [Nannocystis pusilla]|uniref:M20/M25/M40 family metallo-hydrolase n=1 Tax=Nannocystis pusilla TaxID=889268 RepID=UPI003B770A3D
MFVAAVGLLAGALALVQARLEPPPPLEENVSGDMFSATRALGRLGRLIGDDAPHPVGSPAAAALRERMLAEFAALGVQAEVQEGFACGPRSAGCGRVWNVVAALPGREEGPALLVSAHYDSVAAGPGAGDDGSGVAASFEVARALLAGPRPRNPVVFVLVDGEESGLLGAQAFVDAHPRAASIGAVINLDAGGTRGVTSLTRTTASNDGLIAAIAEAVPRPFGASVIGAVYGLTPYDTDFTVYKNAGWPALDFGFGEDKAHYHTPLDRLANLDPASVQHLGDTALAAVRALAGADLAALPERSRVYVDALGAKLLHLRTLWIPGLAALALGLLVPVARRLAREVGGSRRIWLARARLRRARRRAGGAGERLDGGDRLAHRGRGRRPRNPAACTDRAVDERAGGRRRAGRAARARRRGSARVAVARAVAVAGGDRRGHCGRPARRQRRRAAAGAARGPAGVWGMSYRPCPISHVVEDMAFRTDRPALPGVAGADVAAGGGAGRGGVRPRAGNRGGVGAAGLAACAAVARPRAPAQAARAGARARQRRGHGDRRHLAGVHRSAAAAPEPAVPPRRRQRRGRWIVGADARCRPRCRRPRCSVRPGRRSRGTPTNRPASSRRPGRRRPSSRRRSSSRCRTPSRRRARVGGWSCACGRPAVRE